MFFPTVKAKEKSRDMVQVFGGYNHNPRISDGEWYDTLNMSSKDYPLTSARPKRMTGVFTGAATGIATGNMLAYVRGGSGRLYVNGESTQLYLDPTTPKQFVWMGAYLIVFPDAKYINTADPSDYGLMGRKNKLKIGGIVPIALSDKYGKELTIGATQNTAPSNPQEGMLWLDNSDNPYVLKKWYGSNGTWIPVSDTYVSIYMPFLLDGFEIGDGIKISGFTNAPIKSDVNGTREQVDAIDGYHTIEYIAKSASNSNVRLVLKGFVNGRADLDASTQLEISVEREIPEMDYVCEASNRLWGCKYGYVDGELVNEIYCSKLGDFKNWRTYSGISTDSWAGSCGTQGPWTGCVNYNNMPTFFKENFVHRVYVSPTGAHQVTTQEIRGVQQGSWKSIAVVDEVLYYLSRNGVMAYTGASMPVCVSDAFGAERYKNGRAGVLDSMYFLTCENAKTEEENTFVYDAKRAIWQRESSNGAVAYSTIGSVLYWQNKNGDIEATMYTDGEVAPGSGITTSTEEFEWMCETGDIGLTLPDNKYVSRLNIGYKSLSDGEEIRLWMMYDDSGVWEDKGTFRQDVRRTYGLGTITIPVIPVRCDHCRIRITGSKDVKIYSISKIIEQGSDVL